MRGLDTNVLARFFNDDPADDQTAMQRPAAIAAMQARVFISVTVLLEFEWVMRGFYGPARSEIARVLTALLGIGHVSIEDRGAVLTALDAFEGGLEFADALHLARNAQAASFATFDRRLAKTAGRLMMTSTVDLLG